MGKILGGGKILPERKPVLRSSTIILLVKSVGGNKKSKNVRGRKYIVLILPQIMKKGN